MELFEMGGDGKWGVWGGERWKAARKDEEKE